MSQKPIPNFLAKETNPKLRDSIIRKHPVVDSVLRRFTVNSLPNCKKRITVSKMTDELIFYCGNSNLPDEWFSEKFKTRVSGQAFIIGANEKGANTIILNSTKKFKVSSSTNKYDMLRSMISYEDTAYPSQKKVIGILVVFAVEWENINNNKLENCEIIATLYLPPDEHWLRNARVRTGRFFYL